MMQYKCSDILISLISFNSNEFRPKHDINQPLLHLMYKIYENLNKSIKPEFTLGIFLDLKKAFDCYDLDILKKTNSSGLKIFLLTELNICG